MLQVSLIFGTQDKEKQEWTIQRSFQHWVHKTKKNKNGQSRETCNIGYTRGRKIRMVLQVSLDFPFLYFFLLCTQCYKFLWIVHSCFSSSCVPNVTSFSGLSILVCLGNIGYTRGRNTRMENPEKLVTLGTQDEEKQELTFQRNL
jgi:hypothetical protein